MAKLPGTDDPWSIFNPVLMCLPEWISASHWDKVLQRIKEWDLSDPRIWERKRKQRFGSQNAASALADIIVGRQMPHAVWNEMLKAGFVPPYSRDYDDGIVRRLLLGWVRAAEHYYKDLKMPECAEHRLERGKQMTADLTLRYFTGMLRILRNHNVRVEQPLFWGFAVDPEDLGIAPRRGHVSVAAVLRAGSPVLARDLVSMIAHQDFRVMMLAK